MEKTSTIITPKGKIPTVKTSNRKWRPLRSGNNVHGKNVHGANVRTKAMLLNAILEKLDLFHAACFTRGSAKDIRWRRRLPVNSSHGHLVTRSTRHQSTRHTCVSSKSQLVTSEHITKPPVIIFLSACRTCSTQKQCSTRTAYVGLYLRNYGMYRQSEKNLLSSNSFSTCPHNMVNLTH